MLTDFILPIGMTLSIITWSLIMYLYIHPLLSKLSLAKAIEPFLLLHSFRYIGLMFLVPGVTRGALDSRFSHPAAYGDLIAALLALFALIALRVNASWAIVSVWVFNIWGFSDLLNAVVRGILYTPDGHFGATFWIPYTIVPLLLVTHAYLFYILSKNLEFGMFSKHVVDENNSLNLLPQKEKSL